MNQVPQQWQPKETGPSPPPPPPFFPPLSGRVENKNKVKASPSASGKLSVSGFEISANW